MPKKHHAKKAEEIPHMAVEINSISFNAKKVADYAELCGFQFNGKTVPITYPHILAFNLHMELMVNPSFPVPLLGLVHVRNSIRSYRSIGLNESIDIHVSLSEARDTDKGIEFDLTTQVYSQGERVWESVSTNLYRKSQKAIKSPYQPKALKDYRFAEFWTLKENTGRKYAKVSGDSNPIHLHKWTAKAFGFKQAIIHGMWTKARTLAALQPLLKSDAICIETEFKQPIFLPSKVGLHYDENSDGIAFEVRNKGNDKVHMKGRVSCISSI
ncbi:dehydratase [Litoribrevibacter albus]|uniref:Dehydratase n=2 Tax=Litoribrevibacter albus TaxID=1473156 RepID=A0AA37SBW8_9GAMM|nr:dehydratase [Litoribrevibacter albus]